MPPTAPWRTESIQVAHGVTDEEWAAMKPAEREQIKHYGILKNEFAIARAADERAVVEFRRAKTSELDAEIKAFKQEKLLGRQHLQVGLDKLRAARHIILTRIHMKWKREPLSRRARALELLQETEKKFAALEAQRAKPRKSKVATTKAIEFERQDGCIPIRLKEKRAEQIRAIVEITGNIRKCSRCVSRLIKTYPGLKKKAHTMMKKPSRKP